MAKTESTAVTNLINAVQSQPISNGLPAPALPRPSGTPAPEVLAQAQRRLSQQMAAQQAAQQQAAQPQMPPLPQPRPSQQIPAPQVIAPSQLVFPPGMSAASEDEDSWFDEPAPEATEPTDAVDVDFYDYERPRRSRAPIYIATILAVGAGCALGYYLAFGMPGSKKGNKDASAAPAPAAAT
ncbi:MAG TPA: hypothetical protein VL172_14430, partial [Kofleriaceae bacterium]|nr:hypothetical protein [Kofleriaceae bacterium]